MDFIYSYTRKQAIEDGVLIEIDPRLLALCGIMIPTVFTQTLSGTFFEGNDNILDLLEIITFLDTLRNTIQKKKEDTTRIQFTYSDETVVVDVGPDDEGKPCFTIGFPIDF